MKISRLHPIYSQKTGTKINRIRETRKYMIPFFKNNVFIWGEIEAIFK